MKFLMFSNKMNPGRRGKKKKQKLTAAIKIVDLMNARWHGSPIFQKW